jgi:multicomponent Na+:H+ antiporter subunit E
VTAFAWNLNLALAWVALTGVVSALNLLVGFVIGYLLLWWLGPPQSSPAYVRRVPRLVRFTGFYLLEIARGALRVSWDVVTPSDRRKPGIVAVPLDATTDLEITILANLISFTPGTLSLDVTRDRRYLLVHSMFIDSPESFKADLKQRLERRVLEILR